MAFYLLAFVVALAIFGIIRSPNARERLHVRSIYNRGSGILLKHLRVYRQQLLTFLGLDNGNIDILEINDDVDEEPVIEEIPRSDSIEEIQGIRLRSNRSDYRIISEDEALLASDEREEIGGLAASQARDDNVLEAITASLRRLSSAASSGKMSGSQLYEILVQETLLHDKSMRNEAPQVSRRTATSPNAPEEVALQGAQSSAANAAQKTRMYFGQSPLEYTPHQK